MNLSQQLFKLASGGPVPRTEAEAAFSEAPASAAASPAAAGDAARVVRRAAAADELLAKRPQTANLRMMEDATFAARDKQFDGAGPGAGSGASGGLMGWAKAHPMAAGLGLVGIGALAGRGLARRKKNDDEE